MAVKYPSCPPTREGIYRYSIQFINWYSTRLLVILVWCGVIWTILGSDLSPAARATDTSSNPAPLCLPLAAVSPPYLASTIDLSSIFDSQQNVSLSYVLSCNQTTIFNSQYCLTVLTLNRSCPSTISVQIRPMATTNDTIIDNITSLYHYNETHGIDIHLYELLSDILFPTIPPSPSSSSLLTIPEGHFFGLLLLTLCSTFGGFLVNLVRLPPLLGMMIAGIILRNIPSLGLVDGISPVWSSVLRNIALAIILIRGGMALDAKKLWSLKFVLPLLALLPCIMEGAVDGTVSIFYLPLPWEWGLTLGFLLSAISPAVVVPTVLTLKETVSGINEGITTLIVAATNVDVVIAISLFSIFLGLIFSAGNIVIDIFRAPIELTVGVLYGVVTGIILWVLPTKYHTQASKERNRFFLLFGFGLFSLFGGRRALLGGASLAGAGALGTVAVAFVSVQKISASEKVKLSRTFYLVWQFAQPILFGLIGAALDISSITGTLVGKAIVIILVGLIVRIIVAVLSVMGQKFNIKEKIFIACTWLPKATVQAALASVPLDLARQSGDSEQIQYGETILTVAVLAIILTAPTGAVLTGVLGPFLLKHKQDKSDEEEGQSTTREDSNDKNHIKHQSLTDEQIHDDLSQSSIELPQTNKENENNRKETSV